MDVKTSFFNSMINDIELMSLITDVYYKVATIDAKQPFIVYNFSSSVDEQLIIKNIGILNIAIIDYSESAETTELIKQRLIKIFGNSSWQNTDEYISLKTYFRSEESIIEDDEKIQHVELNFDVIWYQNV